MDIKHFRVKAKLSQLELAEKLNVTQGAISHWEVGLSAPRIELLPKLAEVLNCSIDELIRYRKEE